MERWVGKTAVVTGASSGIGSAIAVALANAGLRVVGLARRANLVDKLQDKVHGAGSIVARQCDVSQSEEVAAAFEWVEANFGTVQILVNSAGVLYYGYTTDIGDGVLSEDNVLSTIDINLKGTILCTRHAVASMKRRNCDGHIVNINSVAGHYLPFNSKMNVYTASKHGVTAFTASLNNEFADAENIMKATSISPGLTDTRMAAGAQNVLKLQPEDLADAVLYVLSTPPHVVVHELTLMTTKEKRL